MEKKIGIVTLYYNSGNYGGNLQAYALVEFLKKQNFIAEQIAIPIQSYEQVVITRIEKLKKLLSKNPLSILRIAKNRTKCMAKRILYKKCNKQLECDYKMREKAIYNFNRGTIAHSKRIYNYKDIFESTTDYDVFITGSDQVWNLAWYRDCFFLDFVPSDKKKISYAASISMDCLKDAQKKLFKRSIADYYAVSVRESSDVELIKDLSVVPVIQTLDPTLLLSKEDWDKVSAERVINEKYLFCYFLGSNPISRKLAKDYAKVHNLKVVNLPHMCEFQSADKNFADYKLYDVGPEKFLSLIKYSQCVFTDSFHAVVFSHIYEKNVFVFNRSKKCEMTSRIYNITKLLMIEERYCDTKYKEAMSYIDNLKDIDYNRDYIEFNKLKEFSINFLKENV